MDGSGVRQEAEWGEGERCWGLQETGQGGRSINLVRTCACAAVDPHCPCMGSLRPQAVQVPAQFDRLFD